MKRMVILITFFVFNMGVAGAYYNSSSVFAFLENDNNSDALYFVGGGGGGGGPYLLVNDNFNGSDKEALVNLVKMSLQNCSSVDFSDVLFVSENGEYCVVPLEFEEEFAHEQVSEGTLGGGAVWVKRKLSKF